MSLIEKLNTYRNLTPNQIARKLQPVRWYKFSELTEQDFQFLANRRMVYISHPGYDPQGTRSSWHFWGHNSENDQRYFRENLGRYQAVLYEDYEDGMRPD